MLMEMEIKSPKKRNTEIKNEKTLMHLILRSLLVMKVSHFEEVSRLCLPVRLLIVHLLHPNVIVGIIFFIFKHRKPCAFLKFCFLPVFAYLATLTSSGVLFSVISKCSVTASISVFLLSFVHIAIFMTHPIIIGIFKGNFSIYKGQPVFTFTYPRRIMSIWNTIIGNMFPFLELKYSYPYRHECLFYLIVILDMFLLVMNLAYLRK